jgi:DNA-binding Lrp family transcriptional regulator
VKAYVLIKTQNGSAAVSEALRSMPGFESTEEVTGALDAIALVDVESLSELFDSVLPKVRELPGVIHVLPAPLAAQPTSLATAGAGNVTAA